MRQNFSFQTKDLAKSHLTQVIIDPIYEVLGMLCTESVVSANPHQG